MYTKELVSMTGLTVFSREIDFGLEEPTHKKYPPAVVLIGGGSCSGKTTLARNFVSSLGEGIGGVVISMDDFYLDSREMRLKGIGKNYDDIRAFDIPLIRKVLRELRLGHRVTKPIYDFKCPEVVEHEVVEPTDWIVFEGIYALHPWLIEFGHADIFLDCDEKPMLERRLRRDVDERGREETKVYAQFLETVIPMHRKCVVPTKKHANIIYYQDKRPEWNFNGVPK